MIFIGWIASGAGLFVALENLTLFVPISFLIVLIPIFNSQKKIQNKGEKMYKLVLVLLFAVFANAASLDLVEGKIQAHTEIFGDSEINPQTRKIETILKKDSSIESISGKFEIDAISLVSDNEDRDQHMYEVLNVAKSPKISFVISRITKVDDKYKIDGLLTMNKINKKISSLASITQMPKI